MLVINFFFFEKTEKSFNVILGHPYFCQYYFSERSTSVTSQCLYLAVCSSMWFVCLQTEGALLPLEGRTGGAVRGGDGGRVLPQAGRRTLLRPGAAATSQRSGQLPPIRW